jgi:hypothetical protein
MNNPTLGPGCKAMIGRADIEESKSNVAMNAWLPQASYPCGNFSDTSSLKFVKAKGSIGHAFAVRIRTGNRNQVSFSPFGRQEISVLFELTLGHLRYRLTDVPPQPNSPPDCVVWVGCGVGEDARSTFCQKEVTFRSPTPTSHTKQIHITSWGISRPGLSTLPHILHLPSQFTKSD